MAQLTEFIRLAHEWGSLSLPAHTRSESRVTVFKVNNALHPRKVVPKASPSTHSPTTLFFILRTYLAGRPYGE